MNERDTSVYLFDGFRLEPAERLLLRDGRPVQLTGKAFQTLLILAQRSGHLVEKSELISAVWGDTFVEEGNLAVTISVLRKKLGEKRNEHRFIETVSKQGYRFVADVRRVDRDRNQPLAESAASLAPRAASRLRRVVSSRASRVAAGVIVAALVAFEMTRPSDAAHGKIGAIAVIPFQTSGSAANDSDDAHPATDIADDLVTRLGAQGDIEVRPTIALLRTASARSDPLEVGREQKADAVLVGNLINADGRIRLRMQMLQTRDGTVLWTGAFDKPSSQILALEDQIDESVSKYLYPDRSRRAGSNAGTHDPEAYQLYLEGRYFWNKRTEAGLQRSIDYFQRAVLKDADYAQAYAGLADSYTLLASYGVEGEPEAYPKAKAAALKAIKLDPSLAEAHTSLGMVSFYYEWNWAEAEAEFQRAIALNPNYSMAHTWFALELAATGQQKKALMEAERGVELDPLSLVANTELGRVYYWGRDYRKAVAAYKHAIDLDPYFSRAHTRLGIAYAAQHDYRNALTEFQTVGTLSGPDPYLDGLTGYVEGSRGNRATAQRLLDNLAKRVKSNYVPEFSIALIYMGLGRRDQALVSLLKSYLDRSTYMVYSNVDPLLDPVRSDPQFDSLMTRMSFAPQHLSSAAPPTPAQYLSSIRPGPPNAR